MPHVATPITDCRLCHGTDVPVVFDLGDQALTGRFPKARDEAIASGPLTLVQCADCGLVQLAHNYAMDEMYGETYGYRSGLNTSMVRHLGQRVEKALAIRALNPGDLVVDIGANDGTTLGFYPDTLKRIGIDPASDKFAHHYKPGIIRVCDFFSAKGLHAVSHGQKARIITSFSMFYDLPRPVDFAREVATALAPDGIWVMEQSYLPAMLAAMSYDTVCHEHLEYYALRQIEDIASRIGLKIIDLEFNATNGGSFALTLAHSTSDYPEADNLESVRTSEAVLGLADGRVWPKFTTDVEAARADLLALLRDLKAAGKTVYGYGASTKGNVLLQHCGIGPDLLPAIAEVNPDKYGCYTPQTLIPIIPEIEARAHNPDYFLVLPWHFRDMIVAKEQAYLQSDGGLIFPLPRLEVVKA
jgi:hypothetical protein